MFTDEKGRRYIAARGRMAKEILGVNLELVVMQSAAGFYLGTFDDEGPVSRESHEYWSTREEAEHALKTKEFIQNWSPC